MDLRRVRYFVAVADHLSFRAAADELHVSQSALSEQIAGLERDLNIALFDRTNRRVRLTAAGTEYLVGARHVIADLETCAARAREAQAGRRGSLRVGTVGLAMIDHVPRAVRAFRSDYPDVDVTIQIVRDPDPLEVLYARRVDVVIVTDFVRNDERIAHEFLWESTQRIVLPADHALAGNDEIRLHDLQNETLITYALRGGGGPHRSVLELCREQHFTPKQTREVSEVAELETLLGFVGCGLGFAVLAEPFERMAPPNVVFKPIAGTRCSLQMSACWESQSPNALVQNFVRAAAAL
jgi:DNA-binding transcriptional LysR family regulator